MAIILSMSTNAVDTMRATFLDLKTGVCFSTVGAARGGYSWNATANKATAVTGYNRPGDMLVTLGASLNDEGWCWAKIGDAE